jgi:hypothetical protein
MKLPWILIAAALMALGGCHKTDGGKSAATGGTSMQTPNGGATGQASEGSTDDRSAPKRPASK